MNLQLQYLINLQKFDLRIFQIQDQLRKAPELLKSAELPLQDILAKLQVLKNSGESLVKQRRSSERELATQEEQLQKIRNRLSELKTNKEYQAHLFEIELARKKKDSIEENVLEMMERVEQNEQAVKELEEQTSEARKVFDVEKARLETHYANLANELADLDRQQTTLAELVDKPLLIRYNRLKTMRKGYAVAQLREGACGGCQLQLPPQLVAEVKRGDELMDCSYCHRILYVTRQLEEETTE
ncbi:MAG: C4-type zinc ribbon domain-containing protein [Nitrospirota bacterium]|nr:C4-type zinc ribbon domain-containing protein [Nitrospirota bacterium]